MSAPWHKKKSGVSIETNKLNGITVQSSVYGKAIARGWGTYRVAANLLWYGGFKAIGHTEKAGGKGGGGAVTSTSYTYSSSVMMAIGAGPISSIRSVYKDQSTYIQAAQTPLQQAGLSLMSGTIGQAPWDYLVDQFPDQAIGYSGICYAYAADYDLGSSGTLGNHSFEVFSNSHAVGAGAEVLLDANPRDIIEDFAQSVPFWVSGLLNTDSLDNYGDYCLAANLLLSPVLDEQRQASDFINEILQSTNSEIIASDGQLKIVPYGDTEITGNGVTWTPDLTPIYDLTDDDFLPPSRGEDPVEVNINRPADSYNYIQVEYLDRTHQYNSAVVPGVDQASIDQYGRRQNQSAYQLHSICDSAVANAVAQLIVQRTSNLRAIYKFSLPANYGLLEPMDLVTITSGDLDRVLVRITQIDEVVGDNGDMVDSLQVEAEQMLVGTAQAADYSRQPSEGYKPNPDADPGTISEYALICPPRTLTNGDYEVWVGAAGDSDNWGGAEVWASLDNTNYEFVGMINGRARLGRSSALPVGTDPDVAHVIDVDLGLSGGTLLDGTQSDVDNAITLCLLDSELIAYRDSTLVGSYEYELSYLRRGLYGTTIAAHTDNAPFIRMDETLARVPYAAEQVGSTFYIKLLSFNFLGRATKPLDEISPYSIVLEPGAPPVVDIISQDTKNVAGRPSTQVLTEIDLALSRIATIDSQVDEINDAIDQANALISDANDKILELFGAAQMSAIDQVRDAIDRIDLRDLANTWTKLDGERVTVPVAHGKQVISLLGEIKGDNSAFVFNGSTVWVDDTQSLAQYQIQVQSQYSSSLALINSNFTTLSNQDIAIANAVIGTSATLNGNYTQSYINLSSISTIQGNIYGSITLKTGGTSGGVASMQLLSSGGAINLGAVVFDVDNFLVKSSSNPSVSPFYYDASTGKLFTDTIVVRNANIANLSVDNAKIGNLSVSNAKIDNLAVDTGKIQNNAVSGVVAGENGSPMTNTVGFAGTHLYYYYSSGDGKILVNAYGELGTTGGTAAGTLLQVLCDGSPIGYGSIYCPGSWGGVGLSVPMVHQPGPGTHLYTVQYTGTTGSGSSTINRSVITITELKK